MKKNWQSNNEVKWCPGCGDYAILATMQKTLAELNLDRENTVFVSGIGCAARFPYYMNTYGLHTIHGRGPAFATGINLANPNLNIFLVTGDGDGLSIGASHLLHLFRRNINIKVLLFNNQIYGLTKGQYSPTSQTGLKAKSTPMGSLETPINPISFALSANASFVARSVDNQAAHLAQIIKQAAAHEGTAFIEILQTCVVFHNSAFEHVRNKNLRDKNQVILREHEPIIFDSGSKALAINKNFELEIVENNAQNKNIIIHNSKHNNIISQLLAQATWPKFPIPVGIFKQKVRPSYETLKSQQKNNIDKNISLQELLTGSDTWKI